jgi:CelD/BcsL family acetyltransferase involved in cellulose biosynthesis
MLRVVKDLVSFKELRRPWNDLALKQECRPFLTHEWFDLWLDHFSPGNGLISLLLWEGDRIEAIAPLHIVDRLLGGLSVRCVKFIGNAYSPMRDFLFDGPGREKHLARIIDFFYEYKKWDVIDLGPFPKDSATLSSLRNMLGGKKWSFMEEVETHNWYIDKIDFSGDEYASSRPKKILVELKRRRKRLEEIGNVQVEVITDSNELERYIESYYDVYSRSWKEREGLSANFHGELAKLACEKGWLRLGFLFLDGYPIATQFRIVCGNTCFFLKTAYDVKYRTYGPGLILLLEMIKYVIDFDHVTRIDFGPGDESYKSSWASERKEMKRLLIYNRNLKGCSSAFLKVKVSPFVQKHELLRWMKNRLFQITSSK